MAKALPSSGVLVISVTVNHIAISVSNLRQSRDWYCKMFGLRLIQESEQSVLLGFGDSMLVLRLDPTPGIISHFMFGIDRFDAEELKARLADRVCSPAGTPRVSMSATRTDWTSRWATRGWDCRPGSSRTASGSGRAHGFWVARV